MTHCTVKRLFEKSLSILCAVTLTAACIPNFLSGAENIDDGTTVYDFENGTWSQENRNGFHTGKSESVTVDGDKLYFLTNSWAKDKNMCEIAKDGDNNVLKVYNNSGDTYWPLIMLNNGDSFYELEAGRKYAISFRYKVVSSGTANSFMTLCKGVKSSTQFNIQSLTNLFEENVTSSNTKDNYKIIENFSGTNPTITQWDGVTLNKNANTGTNPTALGNWQTFSGSFTGMDKTVLADGSVMHPYLGIYLTLSAGTEILFDDFEIRTRSQVTLNANGGTFGGEENLSVSGEIGSAINETPFRSGWALTGWYKDPECTMETDGTIPSAAGTVLYAGWEQIEKQTFDFEDNIAVSGKVGDIRVSSYDTTENDNHNVWSVKEENGNRVLNISYPGVNPINENAYQPGALLLNNGEKVASLEPGAVYTVSMRYKINAVGSTNKAWLYLMQSPLADDGVTSELWGNLQTVNNAFGTAHGVESRRIISSFNNSSLSGVNDLNGTPLQLGKWTTFSYSFTAEDYGNGNYVGLATCAVPGLDIYIDDITFVKKYKTITFDTGLADVKISPISGTGKIYLPQNPEYEEHRFIGWFTDSACTEPFTATDYSELGYATKLYAGWRFMGFSDDELFDFEEESGTAVSGETDGVPISSHTEADKNNFTVVTEPDGNRALKISYNGSDANGYKNGTFILNKNGIVPELYPGREYTVTMRVKYVSQINSDNNKTARVALTEDIITGDTGMASEFGTVLGDSSIFCTDYTPGSRRDKSYLLIKDFTNSYSSLTDINGDSVPLGEWHTVTKTFTAYPQKTNGNLYVGITACTATGLSIYIDDIRFISGGSGIIDFRPNGGSTVQPVIAKNGETATLPKPQKAGYVFTGWYLDEKMTERADAEFTVKGYSKLYAGWAYGTSVTFEDYPESWTERVQLPGYNARFSRLAALNTTLKQGDTVLEINVEENLKTNDYTYFALNSGNGNYTVERNVKYLVTFDYLAENVTTVLSVRASTGAADSVWAGRNDHSRNAFRIFPSDSGSGWRSGSFVFTAEPNESENTLYNSLYILTSNYANPTKLYLDNITVTPVTDDTCLAAVDPNNGRDIIYSVGTEGAAVQLPAVSLGGHTFEGWSDNSYEVNNAAEFVYKKSTVTACAIWTPNGPVVDVNRDSSLDVRDMVELKKILAANKKVSDAPSADVDGDGTVASSDLSELKQILLGADSGNVGGRVLIGGVDISRYKIVLPSKVTRIAASEAEELVKQLNSNGGYNIEITDSSAAETEYEILIGNVGRTTDTAVSESEKYSIAVKGKKLVISAGGDEALAGAIMCIKGFYSRTCNKETTLSLSADYSFTGNYYAGENGYKYVWGDEFNGTELNRSLWVDSGDTYETVSCLGTKCKARKSEGCYVENGNAVIYADHDPETGDFTHRQISTNGTHEFLYGCMEVRAKLSTYPGADAIWFSSRRGESGYSQEIDLLEDLSYPENQFASNLHYWGESHYSLDSICPKDKVFKLANGALSDEYHIYTLQWDKDEIKYCVDGKVFFSYEIKNGMKDVGAEVFRQACQTLLSTTMGASTYGPKWKAGDPDRVELLVDYIRLYQRGSDNGYSRETLKK